VPDELVVTNSAGINHRSEPRGASGFLLQEMPGEDIVTRPPGGQGSDSLLAPAVTRRLIQRFAGSWPVVPSSASQLSILTRREMNVLRGALGDSAGSAGI
jgi:hypothetical protein